MSKLSHVDDANRPTMVDVSEKAESSREAHARSVVILPDAVLQRVSDDEISTQKGGLFLLLLLSRA